MALTSQNPETTALLERTVTTLDSGIDSTTPTDGRSLLNEWIQTLHENPSGTSLDTTQLADTLRDLKLELEPEQPDAGRIGRLVQELIDQTQQVMQAPEASAEQLELQRLLSVLQSVRQQLGGNA